MSNASQIFKDDEEEQRTGIPGDDQLRHITGITPDEEQAMEERASAPENASESTTPSGFYHPESDAVSPAGIKDMENRSPDKFSQSATPAASSPEAGLFSGDEHPGRFAKFFGSRLRVSRRQGAIGGALGTTIAGFIFLGLGVGSGPLQFIHMAQLLQQMHSQSQQADEDERVGHLTRFYQFAKTGRIEQTRLGFFANNYANRLEAKMNESGIKSSYDPWGRFQGYEIDNSDKRFGQNDEEVKQYFKDNYGVDVTTGASSAEGRLMISPEKSGYFANRKLIGSMLKIAGYKGVAGAVDARIMGKRAGITWHPIKKIDNKIKSKAFDIVDKTIKQFQDEVENGSTDNGVQTTTKDKAEDANNPDQAAKDKAGANELSTQTNDAINTAESASTGDVKAAASFKAKLSLGGGLSVAGIGIACSVQALDKSAVAEKEAKVIMPLMRLGGDFVAAGNQAMFGGQDNPNFMAQLGALSTKYFAPGDGTDGNGKGSWLNAESLQTNLGHPNAGVAPDSTLKTITQGSPFGFIEDIPGLGAACSGIGQALQNVFAFVTGPASFVVNTIVMQGVMAGLQHFGAIDSLINWLSGKAVNLQTLHGPMFGSYADFGWKMDSDQSYLAAGGRVLSKTEVAQLDQMNNSQLTSEFQQHSFAYKIFNVYDNKTLASSMIDAIHPTVSGSMTQVASGVLNMGSTLFSSLGSLFGTRVHAATNTSAFDYGLPTVGYSVQELSDPSIDNPYTNADYVVQHLLTPDNIAKVQKCFGVSISPDGSSVQAANGNITNIYDSSSYDSNECSGVTTTALKPGAPNSKTTAVLADATTSTTTEDEDWLRLRTFIKDSEIADGLSCYEGDDQSCANVGVTATGSTQSAATMAAITDGSSQLLAQQILQSPRINLVQGAAADIQATATGQQVTPGPIAGDGKVGPCTARTPVTIDPQLLKLMLTISQQYTIDVGAMVSNHNCDAGPHPKGKAMDIVAVNGQTITGNGSTYTGNTALFRQFAVDVMAMEKTVVTTGSPGQGQQQCQIPSISPPSNFNYFDDSCDHLHVDVGSQ